MTQTNFKFKLAASLVLGASLLLPFSAFATLPEKNLKSNPNLNLERSNQEGALKTEQTRALTPSGANLNSSKNSSKNVANVCARLGTAINQLKTRVGEHRQNIIERRQERADDFKDNRLKRADKLQEVRNKAAELRDEVITKLKDKAQTNAQKQAVEIFRQQVASATSVRKAAVDAAIKTFQTGLDAQANSRHSLLQASAYKFKTATDLAVAKAKSDCEAGSDFADIKTELQAAMKAAQDQLKASKQALEKNSVDIKTLIASRDQALKKAADDFHTAIQTARDQLKAAFAPSANPAPNE